MPKPTQRAKTKNARRKISTPQKNAKMPIKAKRIITGIGSTTRYLFSHGQTTP
jgi:hypothetical protein